MQFSLTVLAILSGAAIAAPAPMPAPVPFGGDGGWGEYCHLKGYVTGSMRYWGLIDSCGDGLVCGPGRGQDQEYKLWHDKAAGQCMMKENRKMFCEDNDNYHCSGEFNKINN